MSTIYDVTRPKANMAPARRLSGLLRALREAIQVWRSRYKMEAALYRLSERELSDIGISCGEIEHISRLRSQGILPDEWTRNLPIVDGCIPPR